MYEPPDEERSSCPEDKIVYDPQLGVKVCIETGEVIEEDFISDEPGQKMFSPEEKERKTHFGPPTRHSDPTMGITAQLDQPRESGIKAVMSKTRPPIARPPYHRPTTSSVDKNLQTALNIIQDAVRKLELPSIVEEEASKIYREALQKGLTRGRSIESIAAASLYAACRMKGLPTSLNQIIQAIKGSMDSETKREVARSYRLMVRDLNLKIPVRKPEQFVYSITNALGLPEKVAIEAIKIIQEARRNGLTAGKDPSGMAGAAVYLAALKEGIRKTQKEIAQVAGVTEVTIRNRYKEIIKVIGLEAEEFSQE